MKTAKQIIIDLINSKKINGEEAYTLITSLKQDIPEYGGLTISSSSPNWYSSNPGTSSNKISAIK